VGAAAPAQRTAAEAGAHVAAVTPLPPAELEAFVDGVVRQAMDHDHIAGATVAVVQNGQLVLQKGFGFAASGRLVDPDSTLFRLGQVSSTFTWIALMKDAESGRIRPDSPVNLYLPESLHVADQGYSRPILVRDLMTHTAGFADRRLGVANEIDVERLRPLAQFLAQESPRRVREAGLLPTYSDYGVALAGAAVAFVDNRPFPDLIESEIARPLGMAHTSFRDPYPPQPRLPAPMSDDLARGLSTGYHWNAGGFAPQPTELLSQAAPANGGASTAGDMARYMLAVLGGGSWNGVTLYGLETAKAFRTNGLAAAPGVAGIDSGFLEYPLPGGYRGRGANGDTLWFHAAMVTVPELNLGVFVADNTDTGGALTASLPARIVGRFYAPRVDLPRAGDPGLAAEAPVYEGTYLTTRRPYGGLGLFAAQLTDEIRVRVQPGGRLLVRGAGDGAWVPDGPPGRFVRVLGPQTSAFQISDGRASRWYAPSGVEAYDRIGPMRKISTLALCASLAALAAIATLVGLFTRDRREFRQTPTQSRAGQVQTATAVLWLLAIGCFVAFAWRARDASYLMYAWPTPYLLIGSALALVAALLTFLTLLMTPAVWRGGRRVDSWTGWRKARFTLTTLIFLSFSVLLGFWGALEPWSA
jgi:CubicO group peptidase (beta-lactamase class C family)